MGKNKRSRRYYIQSAKKQKKNSNTLGPKMRGFICTCSDHEHKCVREAYNILNKFANQMYGKEQFEDNEELKGENGKEELKGENGKEELKGENGKEELKEENGKEELKGENVKEELKGENDKEATDLNCENTGENEVPCEEQTHNTTVKIGDLNQETGKCPESQKTSGSPVDDSSDSNEDSLNIEAAIKEDVSLLKKQSLQEYKQQRRFQQVQSGVKNCVFIRTTLTDPLPLSIAIMDNIIQNQKQCTKRLLRMIPIQKTCKAFPVEIEEAAEKLANSYFEKESKTFRIFINTRNNNSVKREPLTASLAKIILEANSKNIPELKTPEVVFYVDIIKSVCCLSILPEYFTKYAKCNLILLANKNKEKLNIKESDDICKENLEENANFHSDLENQKIITDTSVMDDDEKID